MLKLNYTEVGLYMERVMSPLEMAIAQRVILAMRLGQTLQVEPGHASFLLPACISELEQLERTIQQERNGSVTVGSVGNEFVEVSLLGSWVAESSQAHEGMFLTVLGDRSEYLIYRLWQMSETYISTLA